MEENERVPGGNKIAMADGESLHDSDSDTGNTCKSNVRTGSQSLPRFAGPDSVRSSKARKVDSLPGNILNETYEHEDRKTRAKGMIRSFGSFVQKVARQITNSVASASANVGRPKTPAKQNGGVNKSGDSGGTSTGTPPRKISSLESSVVSSSDVNQIADQAPDKMIGMMGIHNHGNTCFMNAIVQCLSNTETLLSYFLTDQYKADIKSSNKHNAKRFGTRGELTEHLATLLRSLWTCRYTPEISTEFKAIVAKYGCQYRGSSQHDAQEFLIWLLDKVHEDLNTATKKKYRANKSSFGRSDEDVAAEAFANHARCNNSYIYDLFQALYRSSLTCPNSSCRHQSNTFDPFLSVSLPIPHSKAGQPVYVTFISQQRKVKVGFMLQHNDTIKSLRQSLADEFHCLPEQIILVETNNKGCFRTLDDERMVCDPYDDEVIYALEVSPTIEMNSEALPVSEMKTTSSPAIAADVSQPTVALKEDDSSSVPEPTDLNIVVLNTTAETSGPQRYSVPRILKLSDRSTLANIEQAVLETMTLSSHDDDNLASGEKKFNLNVLIDKDQITQESVQLSIDDELPFRSDIIQRSLSNFPAGCGPVHVKVLAEWSTTAAQNFEFNETIEEDESVRRIRNAHHQTSLGTLDECFQDYTQEERLGADDAWYCPKCRQLQQGTIKALTLWSLPEILVIHLKRFRQDNDQRAKLNTLVMFPISALDLRHHMQKKLSSTGQPSTLPRTKLSSSTWSTMRYGRKQLETTDDGLYDLYAVCNHYGDMQGGHYTAFCRNPATGTWCSFNDSKASVMREEEVVTRAAYLLFYQKRNSSLSPNKAWLQCLQEIDCNIPRAVTSHSLDNLLDRDCDPLVTTSSPDEEFLRNIPVYTTNQPPPRITRKASSRNTTDDSSQESTPADSKRSNQNDKCTQNGDSDKSGLTNNIQPRISCSSSSSLTIQGGSNDYCENRYDRPPSANDLSVCSDSTVTFKTGRLNGSDADNKTNAEKSSNDPDPGSPEKNNKSVKKKSVH